MPNNITRRSPLWLLIAVLAIVVAAGLTASAVLAGKLTERPGSNSGTAGPARAVTALFPNVPMPGSGARNSGTGGVPDAFAHWVYNGGDPPPVITVPVGTKLNMELWINAGSHSNVSAQQSYMTFTN